MTTMSMPSGSAWGLLSCPAALPFLLEQVLCKRFLDVAEAARRLSFVQRWGFAALLNEPRARSLFEASRKLGWGRVGGRGGGGEWA